MEFSIKKLEEKEKNLIREYSTTILNTVGVEKNFYKFYNQSQSDFLYFPRPDKWITKYKPKFKVIKIFWDLFGKQIFVLIEFLKFLLKKQHTIDIPSAKTILLEFSHKSRILAKQVISEEFLVINFQSKTKNDISIYQLYTINDLIYSLFLSFQALNYFRNLGLNKYSFQFYTMFKWFLTRSILDKINSDFIITNHTDRWAVCADQSQSHKNDKKIILIQHGIVSLSTAVNYNLVYKLKNLKRLYTYDKESYDFFKREIIEDSIEVKYFKPLIELTEMDNSHKIKILVVGHPLCFKKQKSLCEFIFRSYDNVQVYYKPHPTVNLDKDESKLGWIIINEKALFPKVDFLLTYESTLVQEYKNQGIESIVHDFDNVDDISLTQTRIIDYLNTYNIRCTQSSKN